MGHVVCSCYDCDPFICGGYLMHYYSKQVRKIKSGNEIYCQIEIEGEWHTFSKYSEFDDFATTKSNRECLAVASHVGSRPITNLTQIWGA